MVVQRFYRALVELDGPGGPRPNANAIYQRATRSIKESRQRLAQVRAGKLTGDNEEDPQIAAWQMIAEVRPVLRKPKLLLDPN